MVKDLRYYKQSIFAIMKTERSFITKQECAKIQKKFSKFAEIGGWDGYELDSSDKISAERCESISSQFEVAELKGGEYFCNIIFYPHYTSAEINSILDIIN